MKITDIITSIETLGDDMDQTTPATDAVDPAPGDDAAQVDPKKAKKSKPAKELKVKKEKAVKVPRALKAPKEPKADKGPNKKEIILSMLRTSEGATIEELMKATGWQKHSVHGQLANMRKKDGLAIVATKTKVDDGKGHLVYTLTA